MNSVGVTSRQGLPQQKVVSFKILPHISIKDSLDRQLKLLESDPVKKQNYINSYIIAINIIQDNLINNLSSDHLTNHSILLDFKKDQYNKNVFSGLLNNNDLILLCSPDKILFKSETDEETDNQNGLLKLIDYLSKSSVTPVEDQKKHSSIKIAVKLKISEINKKIGKAQQVTVGEIEYIFEKIKQLQKDRILKYPVFLRKCYLLKHSVVVYEYQNKLKILFKPNLHNNVCYNHYHPYVQRGSRKIIKTTGIEITFNKYYELESVDRVVTYSKNYTNKYKNSKLKNDVGELVKSEGFREVIFKNNINNTTRILYVKEYYGEDLYTLMEENKLSMNIRLEIMRQLIDQLKPTIYDIKLENILWDGRLARFIDDKEESTTYTHYQFMSNFIKIQNSVKDDQEKVAAIDLILRDNQPFTLSLLFFQLSANCSFDKLNKFVWQFDYKRNIEPQYVLELLRAEDFSNNPFAGLLYKAYTKEVDADHFLEEIKDVVSNLEINIDSEQFEYKPITKI
ncbi:MAG: hypothetical protein ACK5Z5_08305 [Neisseriaceae bacterium]